jgi:D-beta-D-heptose 7-phosphate kinase/D-beta-D-heptose 1-phosphate adenosyltransferase
MDRSPHRIVEQFRGAKILVIGDAMLDVYLRGISERICREAPVQVVEVTAEQKMAGGAANSAVNCADLGAEVFFVSSVGTDEEGEALLHILRERNVHTSDVIRIPRKKTVTKERIFANDHMLLRFDKGRREPLQKGLAGEVVESLMRRYPHVDAVMMSDYEYGLVTPEVVMALLSLQEQYRKPLLVDSRYLAKYANFAATAIKPNYEEVVSFLGTGGSPVGEDRVEWVRRHGNELLQKTGASVAAITIDSLGSLVFERGQAPYRTYSSPVQSTQAVGAGDTYSSVFLLALAQHVGASYAAELASIAASLVLEKVGTATCSVGELQTYLLSHRKHIDAQGLEQLVNRYREQGRKIVFTNGCFDILHAGHINYLNQAKALGDVMIVGMNDDESIRRLKGQGRPINTLADRLQVLAGLSSVDHIVAFAEDSPAALIERIKPDVYAKGADYTLETLPEAPLVESLGGTVELIPVTGGKSTTNIIKRIQESSLM